MEGISSKPGGLPINFGAESSHGVKFGTKMCKFWSLFWDNNEGNIGPILRKIGLDSNLGPKCASFGRYFRITMKQNIGLMLRNMLKLDQNVQVLVVKNVKILK